MTSNPIDKLIEQNEKLRHSQRIPELRRSEPPIEKSFNRGSWNSAFKHKINISNSLELNTKNFPSKANVCKGLPKINYDNRSNNFPIFNYYSNGELFFNQSSGSSSFRDSFNSQNFNFSPSNIFNKRRSGSYASSGLGVPNFENLTNNFNQESEDSEYYGECEKQDENLSRNLAINFPNPTSNYNNLINDTNDNITSSMPISNKMSQNLRKAVTYIDNNSQRDEISDGTTIVSESLKNINSDATENPKIVEQKGNQAQEGPSNNYQAEEDKKENDTPEAKNPSENPSNQKSASNKKFKRNKRLEPSQYNKRPLNQLAQNLVMIATDQGGCRFLQKLIDENPSETIRNILPSLMENLIDLINDPFGNYLVQKIFPFLQPEQFQQMISSIGPSFLETGTNPHGTRVLQQLIKNLKLNKALQEAFYKVMMPHIIPLLQDINGTHIVQKFSEDYTEFSPAIDEIIISRGHELAMNRHGCCVIQRYFEVYKGETLHKLILHLISTTQMLIVDQFGNYVIQTIFSMRKVDYANAITEKISEDVLYYAKHKYSSNVVEKCFDYCDGETKQKIICNLAKPEVTQELILDDHGNYIIQKAISVSDAETRDIMMKVIVPMFDKLRKLPFGEKIIGKLRKAYPEYVGKAKKKKHYKKHYKKGY